MRRNVFWTLVGFAAALVVTADGAGFFARRARADEEPAEPSAQERTFVAVRTLLKTLATTNVGPVPGARKDDVLPQLASWSEIATDWMAALETSPYAPGPGWKGVVRVYLGEDVADDLAVHLLVPGVERAALRAFVPKVLVELGYSVSDDPENRWSLWGLAGERREVWIGVGEGLLSVEVNLP